MRLPFAAQNMFGGSTAAYSGPDTRGAGGYYGVSHNANNPALTGQGSGGFGADPATAGDCAGTCGGLETSCFEATGSAVDSNWTYKGTGQGSYKISPQYNFVGQGAGSYDREIVTRYYGWRFKPCCLFVLALLLLVPFLLFGLQWFFDSSTPMPIPTPAPAPLLTASAPRSPPPSSPSPRQPQPPFPPLPPPPPPPRLPPATPPAIHYDCNALHTRWSADKRAWCCAHTRPGCPHPPHPAMSLPFDCNAALVNWKAAWSVQKKQWCCQHEGKGCQGYS